MKYLAFFITLLAIVGLIAFGINSLEEQAEETTVVPLIPPMDFKQTLPAKALPTQTPKAQPLTRKQQFEKLKSLTIPDFPDLQQSERQHQQALTLIKQMNDIIVAIPSTAVAIPSTQQLDLDKIQQDLEHLSQQQKLLEEQFKQLNP